MWDIIEWICWVGVIIWWSVIGLFAIIIVWGVIVHPFIKHKLKRDEEKFENKRKGNLWQRIIYNTVMIMELIVSTIVLALILLILSFLLSKCGCSSNHSDEYYNELIIRGRPD